MKHLKEVRKKYYQKNKEKIKQQTKEYYQKNKQKISEQDKNRRIEYPEIDRDYARKQKYGITPEKFNRMKNAQNNLCAICKKPETQKQQGRIKNLSIDHCHITGKIRGLLCHRCNLLVGIYEENLIEKIKEYLEKY